MKHMPFFKEFGRGVERHIRHEYYKEMSAKSEVVSAFHNSEVYVVKSLFACIQIPLGILIKSEMCHAHMISILEELHRYVPVVTSTSQTDVLVEGEVDKCTITDDQFHHLLFGEDQLTAPRARECSGFAVSLIRLLLHASLQ